MPPQRDAATMPYPYLTHITHHHGQLTLTAPDNCGRRRKAKQNRPEFARNIPREEPVRFSTGPVAYPSSSGRPSRRLRRPSATEDPLDDIPDYPPPSFLEAMSSPAVSVCPSTTTLGFPTPQASRHNSHSDSDSDDASLDIIDTGTVPRSLESTAGRTSPQSQAPTRGRGILDSDPDEMGRPPSFSNRSQRRHLSLSPLRTLFPSRNPRESGHALSAQSTPSPQSLTFSHSSPFFRSTTSLRNLTASTPFPPPSPSSAPSIRSESLLASRRFFSHKGKERATSEALESWEIVESELPAAFTTLQPEDVSPVHDISLANMPPQSPISTPSTPAHPFPAHPLSERDRLVKAKSRIPLPIPNPARERERRPPPPPPPALAPGEAPPIVTVRTKKPPPPPPPKRKPVSSPLRDAERPIALSELDLERAVRTPLPMTPVTGSPTWPFSSSAEPGSPTTVHGDPAHNIPLPAPRSSSGTLPFSSSAEPGSSTTVHGDPAHNIPLPAPRSSSGTSPFSSSAEPGAPSTVYDDPAHNIPLPAPRSSSGTSENESGNAGDAAGQHHHHYPGRPLPLRPRVVVDSTYASHPDFPQVPVPPLPPSVPEGLLIDLDGAETPTVQAFQSVSADLNQLTPLATEMHRSSSDSSVDLAPVTPSAEFLEVTDLDVLLARLENDQRDGGNYDALWMVSEFIGPATPVRAAAAVGGPNSSSALWTPPVKTSILLTGHIEVQRRRITKDGRVKLKLALLGIAVDRCGICMTQFKKAESARLSEGCKHAFHDRCLARWVARSRTCPLCRVVLEIDPGR